jgi:hypothetical protein
MDIEDHRGPERFSPGVSGPLIALKISTSKARMSMLHRSSEGLLDSRRMPITAMPLTFSRCPDNRTIVSRMDAFRLAAGAIHLFHSRPTRLQDFAVRERVAAVMPSSGGASSR